MYRVFALKETTDWGAGRRKGTTADLQPAFGVSRSKLAKCLGNYYNNSLSLKRKENPRVGLTIFNSDEKRKEISTPLEYYKRLQRKRNRKSIPEPQLNRAFAQLDVDALHQC